MEPNPSVLVIDDDRLIRVALAEHLGAAGYRVSTAEDGLSGLQATREHQPDFVICDWVMPQVDGLEYCRRLRADPELAGLHVTVLTGRAEPEDKIAVLDAGANDVLTKPVDPEELLARIRAGIRRRRPESPVAEEWPERAGVLGDRIGNRLTALFGHLELLRDHLERGSSERALHHTRAARHVAGTLAEIGHELTRHSTDPEGD